MDYKFFCFNGEPYCLYVMNERFTNTGVRQNIMDLDYNIMPYMREKIEPIRTKFCRFFEGFVLRNFNKNKILEKGKYYD